MDDVIQEVTDTLQALERAHARTGKLIDRLHKMLEKAVKDHGASVGISPASVAPKD
jgi:hypothetical protein